MYTTRRAKQNTMITTRRKNQLKKFKHNVIEHFIITPFSLVIDDKYVYIYTDFLMTSIIMDINKFTKNCQKNWFVVATDGIYKLKISITI